MVKVLQWKIANWNYSPRRQCKNKKKKGKRKEKETKHTDLFGE